jgi:hypothetical protein
MRVFVLITFVVAIACTTRELAPAASSGSENLPAAPVLDEARFKRDVHAFFDAHDTTNDAAFLALVSPSFTLVKGDEITDRAAVVEHLQQRRSRGLQPWSRTWNSERWRFLNGAAVFVGESLEHLPADGPRPAKDYTGLNTVVFVAEHGTFRAIHWHWQQGGLEAVRTMFNAEYTGVHTFSDEPNRLLVDSLRDQKPGTALDVACGTVRNGL